MIEVEKNFDLKPGDKERLIRGAKLVSEKTFTDVYYDSADYDLTSRDFWLRARDHKFELKVPLNAIGAARRPVDQYRELETDAEIAFELHLSQTIPLARALQDAGYAPCATITTKRESYLKNGFHLDFDKVDALRYATFEVELMVDAAEAIPDAEKRILDFAREHGIVTPGRSKINEYLTQYNSAHYAALRAKGIFRD